MRARTYGTVSTEQQRAMSGLEFVQGLAGGALPLNTIAQTLGYPVRSQISAIKRVKSDCDLRMSFARVVASVLRREGRSRRRADIADRDVGMAMARIDD